MTKAVPMRLIIIGILVVFITAGHAEVKMETKPADTFAEAFDFYSYSEYTEALPLFLSLYRKEETNDHLLYLIAVCYINIEGQRQRALPFLEEAAKNISVDHQAGSFDEKSAPPECLYHLGVAYRLAYRFEESLGSFSRLKDLLEDKYDMHKIERETGLTKNAAMFFNNRENIRTYSTEELPATDPLHSNIVISGDESAMVYTEPQRFYDAVFYTSRTGEGWSRPVNITMQLKSDGLAYPVSLSYDGDELYLYQYDLRTNTNLYVSRKENGRWSAMEKLGSNINSAAFEQHAAVTKNRSTLYFSSSRLPGKGFDIYRSRLDENQQWGPAENLGYPVNTDFDESFPFISPDGNTLFFSSTGHTGMGGYDIFFSQKSAEGTWSVPRNLGYPVNTPDQDAFLIPTGDGTTAYMNLRQESNNDIRVFQKISSFMVDPGPPWAVLNLMASSIDEHKDLPVDITILQTHPFDSIIRLRAQSSRNDTEVKLPWGNYQVEFSSTGHQPESLPFSIPEYYPEKKYYVSATLKGVELPGETISARILELEPVFFGFDRHLPDEGSLAVTGKLAGILNEYKDIVIELKGYTDALGPAAYNKHLAGLRAGSVADALIEKGVEKERISITAVGMGDYIARNRTVEGGDSPEGRKFNRRVEFVLINIPGQIRVENKDTVPEHLKEN
jgi:outer membrane protein OmpA-like peptidoglycan-associated protein/tetratricopeptide (TPR) repeat protein